MEGTPRRRTIGEQALRSLGARTWAVALSMSVLALGCSNNEGPTGPSFPASQTGKTALALFPQSVNITAPNDGGTCVSRIQFLATGGEPPYKFFTAFSAGPGSGLGKSTIDANGLYTAELSAGATLAPDTVVVIDSVGAQATTKDITIKCV
jgi:hypothetical protein